MISDSCWWCRWATSIELLLLALSMFTGLLHWAEHSSWNNSISLVVNQSNSVTFDSLSIGVAAAIGGDGHCQVGTLAIAVATRVHSPRVARHCSNRMECLHCSQIFRLFTMQFLVSFDATIKVADPLADERGQC